MSSKADKRMEITIGNTLRIGVTIAASIVLAGWILYLGRAQGTTPDYAHFHGSPTSVKNLGPILEGVRAFDSRSIILLGILLLIATPVVRVMLCIASFAAQRDRLYVLVSSTVFAVLIYGLFFRS